MQKIERLSDWQSRLCRYIHSIAARRFRPCAHDCIKFGAGAVAAQTGVDLAQGWADYRTIGQGLEMLKAQGYADHVSLVADLLPEIPPLFARAGDIAILDGDMGQSVGVVQGHSIYVVTMSGLSLVPLTDAKRAFRV